MAAALAFVMQGNVVASLLATFFGNPLTFPIIAAICLEVGQWMLGTPNVGPLPDVFAEIGHAWGEVWHNIMAMFTPERAHWHRLEHFFWSIIWPYTAGGMVPGVFTAVAVYMLTLPAVEAYQRRRVARLQKRYQARVKAMQGRSGAAE